MNQLEKQNPDEAPPCCNCNCNQGRGCIYRQAVTPLHELEGPPPQRDRAFEFLAWVAGIVTVVAILAGVML